ncbi:MAG TPA: hypothetical protein DHV77_03470 [Erysipelotrichaceae bacterium]|nr:hypothetical protein [Erysipelotrichaceae bacterium]
MKPQRSQPQKKGVKLLVSSFLFGLASLFNGLLPSMKNIVSLCSTPDFTDSAKAVFDYIATSDIGKKLVLVWHVKQPGKVRAIYNDDGKRACRVMFVKKNHFLSFIMFCLSRYIVDTHGLYSMVNMKNEQRSVYLTHGMPVKKFGFEYDNDIKNGVQYADYSLATSIFYKSVIARSMGIPETNVFPIGLPRNDVFFINDQKREQIDRLLSCRYVLYLPTYRVSDARNKSNGVDLSSGDKVFGGTIQEWEILNMKLKDNGMKIVIKPHPLEMNNDLSSVKTYSQIVVIDDNWIIERKLSLNIIMKYSSGLITDYSGAFVDYLLTDKPIAFFMPDYTEYSDSRGYVFESFDQMIPGEKVTCFSDIFDAIKADRYAEKRKKLREKINTQQDETASEQVCKILFDELVD